MLSPVSKHLYLLSFPLSSQRRYLLLYHPQSSQQHDNPFKLSTSAKKKTRRLPLNLKLIKTLSPVTSTSHHSDNQLWLSTSTQ
jgi:hypothetical protein